MEPEPQIRPDEPNRAMDHKLLWQGRIGPAFWMGYSEMFDTYDWFINYLDRLASVTPQDVQRIAQTYLRPQKRVLGIYLPTGFGVQAGGER